MEKETKRFWSLKEAFFRKERGTWEFHFSNLLTRISIPLTDEEYEDFKNKLPPSRREEEALEKYLQESTLD